MHEDHSSQIHIVPPKMLVIAATGTLGILSLFLFVLLMGAVQNLGHSDNTGVSTISVDGTGKSTAAPDLATITFSVTATAKTQADAQSAAATKSNTILAALKTAGIADSDVKTDAYNVYPHYTPVAPCVSQVVAGGVANGGGVILPCTAAQPTADGYDASQGFEVKVHDITKVGDLLQQIGSLGADTVNSSYGFADGTTQTDKARAAAIADAKQKAVLLASQLGIHLGKLVNFSENGGGGVYPVAFAASSGTVMDKAAAPNLPTGQNDTTDDVTLVYEIR